MFSALGWMKNASLIKYEISWMLSILVNALSFPNTPWFFQMTSSDVGLNEGLPLCTSLARWNMAAWQTQDCMVTWVWLMTWLRHMIFFHSLFFFAASYPSSAHRSVSQSVCPTLLKQFRRLVCVEDSAVSWVWVTCRWCLNSYEPTNESIRVNYTCLGPTAISPLLFPVWLESFLFPVSTSIILSPLVPLSFHISPVNLLFFSFFSSHLPLPLCLPLTTLHSLPLSVLLLRVSWWSFV